MTDPNYTCRQCGYVDRSKESDPHQKRAKLMLHSHYTGLCPVNEKHVDGEGKQAT